MAAAKINYDALLLLLGRLRSSENYMASFVERKSINSIMNEIRGGRAMENAKWTQDTSCRGLQSEDRVSYHDLPKCRDCHAGKGGGNHHMCRFQSFRTFELRRGSQKPMVGFMEFSSIKDTEDVGLWLPVPGVVNVNPDEKSASLVLRFAGDLFCRVVAEEQQVHLDYTQRCRDSQEDCQIAYKRLIPKVREICDVCETTLFNYHWQCRDCGFVVCIDCYKEASGLPEEVNPGPKKRSLASFTCTKGKQRHRLADLMLTQFIPGEILFELCQAMHFVREQLDIPFFCSCERLTPEVPKNMKRSPRTVQEQQYIGSSLKEVLKWRVENFALEKRELKVCPSSNARVGADGDTCRHRMRGRAAAVTSKLYPDVPHSFLCNGKMLWLHDGTVPQSIEMFQREWRAGQPVLVSNTDKKLNTVMWSPQTFGRDFGFQENDLTECLTGVTFPEQPMHLFWDGFDDKKRRPTGKDGRPMLLKLKDWPPQADFASVMPHRFLNLMDALPVEAYTLRNGALNLAAYLPDHFLAPDLGPKMYIAYGSTLTNTSGTTNLHLDISDAVNVMVYVGTGGGDRQFEINRALDALIDAGCDLQTLRCAQDPEKLPGALWHIYEARDAPKIRNLLFRVARERKENYSADSDPIHDQLIYLDNELRARLYKEYGVIGYSFVQRMGDAVFIPAGAPHQVRNILNCIKVAEDFVSPETVAHCFDLTQQFRRLSDSHMNREDKLQIKNIVYQSIRQAVGVLLEPAIERFNARRDALPAVGMRQ